RLHYVMIDRKGALELFNNYLLPGIEHKHRGSQLVASLAPGGLDLVVDRAQAVAARFGVPQEDVVAASLGNAISHVGPETVLDWLRSSPVSPTSDRAVGEIARVLRFYGANRDVDYD